MKALCCTAKTTPELSIAMIVKGVETLKRLSSFLKKVAERIAKTTMDEAKRQGITPEAAETKFLK